MSEVVPLSFLSEAEVLKRAARLVDSGELEKAIKLLQEAHSTKPRSEKLLGVLGNLYQKLGEFEKAAKYTEAAFDSSLNNSSGEEFSLPSEDDFSFLVEQSRNLEEIEYNFEKPQAQRLTIPRKTLSLKTKQKVTSDEKNRDVKIFYKNKPNHSPVPATQAETELEPIFTNAAPPVPTSHSSEVAGKVEPKEKTEPLRPIDEYREEEVDQEDAGLDETEQESELDQQSYFDDLVDADDSSEAVFDTSTFNEMEEESDLREEPLSFEDNEAEFYAFWDDEASDEQENTHSGALENRLTPEERARLVAVECILEFGWHTSKLHFLVDVFTSAGWSNSRRALEREVESGSTCEELELAFEVKRFWQDSSRYWITFSKAWVSGESADATYRHCSWKQALRLVRLYDNLPILEEIEDFLETEFEYWYHNKVLRLCFPAFNKYLFNYRLHDRNIDSMMGGFGLPEDYDGMNASWSYHTNTNEIQKLKEMGIDLVSKFAPKSYFTSDIYTKEYLLEIYRSCAKSQQGGTE